MVAIERLQDGPTVVERQVGHTATDRRIRVRPHIWATNPCRSTRAAQAAITSTRATSRVVMTRPDADPSDMVITRSITAICANVR
jgi:hypothetical protein